MELNRHRLSICWMIVVSLHCADVSDPDVFENCTDYRNQVVPHGERFRPMNADACHTCSCEYGRPEMCQSRLCSAPKGCANPVSVEDTCCEFECLDDGGGGGRKTPSVNGTILEPTDDLLSTTNLGLRLVASTVTSFLILALLLFMIHRLRQRRLLLMLRRLDMNGSHLSSAPFGIRRYSFDDDGSVGYLTGQDQVDFAPYDEPPPPYTFWKPPESYFPQEEAPPPYEASNNHNSINNAVNSSIHQNGGVALSVAVPLANIAPLIPNPYPGHCITPNPYLPPASVYANANLPNGTLPSVTQVPLRANNFNMNNLDEVREPNTQRHSVPIQDLNVVGSLSSLNSSQSELNDSHVEPALSPALVIRSDAVYEEYSAGMLPPLSPAASTGGSAGVLGTTCGESNVTDQAAATPTAAASISTGTYSVKRSKYGHCADGKKPTAAIVQNSPFKCHSCSDVPGCWHPKKQVRDVNKRRSLQPDVQFCPDPTAWSETSSSSSPTYERTTGTLSPTSSDSSSVDYHFGHGCAAAASAHNLPRRTHSATQFEGNEASVPSLGGGSVGAVSASPMSSSLDRTLFNLRSKISLKKKRQLQPPSAKGQPGKLRKLLGGLHASPVTENASKDDKREKQDLCPVASTAKPASATNENDGGDRTLHHCASSQRPGWRTPRILYVSDGDISLRSLLGPKDGSEDKDAKKARSPQVRPHNLDLEKRCRPHSYDFGDLQSAECQVEEESAAGGLPCPIKEEGTPASGEDASRSDNLPSLATNTVDCCCSLSSDRLGSSWDSFTCTCSSRASFGSGSSSSSTQSHEVASNLASPARCLTVVANSPEDAGAAATAARLPLIPTSAEQPRTRASVNRSSSVCSETGEKKHRLLRQQSHSIAEASPPAVAEAQTMNPACEVLPQRDCHPQSGVNPPESNLPAAGPPPPTLAVANRIRVTIGTWKGSHESYI